jgi:hypothetical protein
MTMTLINRTGRMKVYNLPHKTYCAALGKCACTVIPGRSGARVCASLTLAAGAEVDGVSEAVLQVAEIAKDIVSGALRVKRARNASIARAQSEQADTKRLSKKKRRSKATRPASSTGGQS